MSVLRLLLIEVAAGVASLRALPSVAYHPGHRTSKQHLIVGVDTRELRLSRFVGWLGFTTQASIGGLGSAEPLMWGRGVDLLRKVNNRRLMEPIGNILPAEAEARYYAMQDALPKAA